MRVGFHRWRQTIKLFPTKKKKEEAIYMQYFLDILV